MFKFLKSSFKKVKEALSKTRSILGDRITSLLKRPIDEETFEELEMILFEADLGTKVALDFSEVVRTFLQKKPDHKPAELMKVLQEHALKLFEQEPEVTPTTPETGPSVTLVVGVNGSGKTTSIAKLAQHYKEKGEKVLLAAGDTFRAAAIEQLTIWSKRTGIDIVKGLDGGDPAAVVYDALQAATARGCDRVLIDTAGRLQNKDDLMRELKRIKEVGQKIIPEAPHETLLVLDATTGQNAIDQAKVFHQFVPLSGLVLTKLDGSAKGGIILSIYKELGIPVKWIGVGESSHDLLPFDAQAYVEALFPID